MDANSSTAPLKDPGQGTGQPALELRGVSKSFLGVHALTDASLTCLPGEVHALVGENGAGKSTLIKVAAGALRPDAGEVVIGGEPLRHARPVEARRMGLLTAYQDTSLVPSLTVADNVLLSFHGTRAMGGTLRRAEARELLAPYELSFGPDDLVAGLSPASRQLLEIVRAMLHRPKVLLLDEPTAALDAVSIRQLEVLVERAREGGAAILYISHRLDEVQRIAQRLTVIRDGRIEGTYEGSGWDVEEIVTMMVGARTDLAFPEKRGATPESEPSLVLDGFRGDGFGPISFAVRPGEIVGVAGAEGNGQRELVRALVGLRRGRGRVSVGGSQSPVESPLAALRRGISFQSGDRAAESVFRELSVVDNSTLAVRGELGPIGAVLQSRQRGLFRPIAERLGIVRASDHQPLGELSGGNQQKVVLSRAILREAPVLVADEPTAGVDARARLDIYRALRERAEAGAAILVNSSDATELEGLCDRVHVISRGKVVAVLEDEELSDDTIVESFVNAGAKRRGDPEEPAAEDEGVPLARSWWARAVGAGWAPVAVLALLLVALGAYTASRTDIFFTDVNLNSLLISALPLIVVALGQQALLIAGGFDISIGSNMTVIVCLASFVITAESFAGTVPGLLLCLAAGVAIGLANGAIVRVLNVSPIITTIGTLGILQGIAILMRPEPGGLVGSGLTDVLGAEIGFVPIFFVIAAGLAVVADLVLRTTPIGLTFRAVGFSEEASRRTGVRIEVVKIGAYVIAAAMAALAGLFLAVQVGIGDNSVGTGYTLSTFTACFLGGAALTGGRGSFVGAMLGAVFVSMLINVTPLLELETAWSTALTIGALRACGDSRRVSIRWRSRPGAGRADIALAPPAAAGCPGSGRMSAIDATRSGGFDRRGLAFRFAPRYRVVWIALAALLIASSRSPPVRRSSAHGLGGDGAGRRVSRSPRPGSCWS